MSNEHEDEALSVLEFLVTVLSRETMMVLFE